jgi:hypothetical protein
MSKMLYIKNKFEAFISNDGRTCSPAPYKDGFIVPQGWERELSAREITYSVIDLTDDRQLYVEQLQSAAKKFAELIHEESEKVAFVQSINAFFFENSKVFINYVMNGGNDVIDLFRNSEEEWLDITVPDDDRTPREYALNMLN